MKESFKEIKKFVETSKLDTINYIESYLLFGSLTTQKFSANKEMVIKNVDSMHDYIYQLEQENMKLKKENKRLKESVDRQGITTISINYLNHSDVLLP